MDMKWKKQQQQQQISNITSRRRGRVKKKKEPRKESVNYEEGWKNRTCNLDYVQWCFFFPPASCLSRILYKATIKSMRTYTTKLIGL